MSNKPIVLSRACIRDTLLLKRLCPEKMTGLALSLYNLNVQTLRRHQLAPYVETKMRPHMKAGGRICGGRIYYSSVSSSKE